MAIARKRSIKEIEKARQAREAEKKRAEEQERLKSDNGTAQAVKKSTAGTTTTEKPTLGNSKSNPVVSPDANTRYYSDYMRTRNGQTSVQTGDTVSILDRWARLGEAETPAEQAQQRQQAFVDDYLANKQTVNKLDDDKLSWREKYNLASGMSEGARNLADAAGAWENEYAYSGDESLEEYFGSAEQLLSGQAQQLEEIGKSLYSPEYRRQLQIREDAAAQEVRDAGALLNGDGARELTAEETIESLASIDEQIALYEKLLAEEPDNTVYRAILKSYGTARDEVASGEVVNYDSDYEAFETAPLRYAEAVAEYGDARADVDQAALEAERISQQGMDRRALEAVARSMQEAGVTPETYAAEWATRMVEIENGMLPHTRLFGGNAESYTLDEYAMLKYAQEHMPESADRVEELLEIQADARRNEAMAQAVTSENRPAVLDNPVMDAALGVTGRVASTINGIDILLQRLDQKLGGRTRINYERTAGVAEAGEAATQSSAEDLAELGSLEDLIPGLRDTWVGGLNLGKVYQAGVDSLASAANAAIFGRFTGAATGLQVGASTFHDAKDRGAMDDTASKYYLSQAFNEGLGEQVSYDAFINLGIRAGMFNTRKGKLALGVLQAANEGLQEGATEQLNLMADRAIMGVLSNHDTAVREAMAAGYAQDEAEVMVREQEADQVADAILGGAIGGAMRAGTTYAGQGVNDLLERETAYRDIGASVLENDNAAQMAALIGEVTGKETAAAKRARQAGRQYSKFVKNAEKYVDSARAEEDTAALLDRYAALQEESRIPAPTGQIAEAMREIENARVEGALRDTVRAKYGDKKARGITDDDVARNAAKAAKEYREGQTQIDRTKSGIIRDKVERVKLAAFAKLEGTSEATRQKAEQRLTGMQKSDAGASYGGDSVKVNGFTSVGDKAVVTVTKADGSAAQAPASEVTFSGADAEIYAYAADMATPELANRFRMTVQPDQLRNIDRVANAYSQAYDMARAGFREESVAASYLVKGVLTGEQVSGVYKLGADVRKAERIKAVTVAAERAKASMGNAWKGGTASFDDSVDVGSLTETQKTQVDMASVITGSMGINVVFFESQADAKGRYTAENGRYDRRTNTIYLDVNAGRNSRSDSMSQTALLRTLSHEITHAIQRNSPEIYGEIRDMVVEVLGGAQGITIEDLIDAKMARDSSLETRDAALDEVVADACETMLRDSDAMRLLQEAHPEAAKTFGETLKELAGRIIEAIKAAFKGRKLSTEAQLLMQDAERYREIADKWARGVVETAEVSGRENGTAETDALADEKAAISEDTAVEGENIASEELVGAYDEPARPAETHIDNRTWEAMGERGVRAFMNEYKYARSYMGPAAKALLQDANASLPGERYRTADGDWGGQKRQTTDVLAELKDRGGWTWEQLKDALGTISDIYDDGDLETEIPNTAIIRRTELMLDEMLTQGYTAMDGVEIVPDAGYQEYKAQLPGAAAYEAAEQPDGVTFEEYTQFQVRETTDGRKAVVIENDILAGIYTGGKWTKERKNAAKTAAKHALTNAETSIMGGIPVYINAETRKEFPSSNYVYETLAKEKELLADRYRAAAGGIELVEAAVGWHRDDNYKIRTNKIKHIVSARVLMQIGKRSYDAKVDVGVTKTGKYVLYDLVDLTSTTFDIKKDISPTADVKKTNVMHLEMPYDGIITQPASDFNPDSKKQARDPEQVSDRELLVTALQEEVANAEEASWLAAYKEQIGFLEETQRDYDEQRRIINKLNKKVREAQEDARQRSIQFGAEAGFTRHELAQLTRAEHTIEQLGKVEKPDLREQAILERARQNYAELRGKAEEMLGEEAFEEWRKVKRVAEGVDEAAALSKDEAEDLQAARNRAKILSDRMAKKDADLLEMEGSKPIRQIVERERKRARSDADRRIKKVRDNYETRALRQKLKRKAATLDERLRHPKDGAYIPDGLREAARHLDAVVNDLEVGYEVPAERKKERRLDRISRELRAISKENTNLAQEVDVTLLDELDELDKILSERQRGRQEKEEQTGKKPRTKLFTTLTRDELKTLERAVDHMLYLSGSAYDVKLEGEKLRLEAAALKEQKRIEGMHAKARDGVRKLLKQFWVDETTPVYFFGNMGGAFQSAAQALFDGESDYGIQAARAAEEVQDIKRRRHYDSWFRDGVLELHARKGGVLLLNREEALMLYATHKREQTNIRQDAQHLAVGGVVERHTDPRRIFKKAENREHGVKLNDDDMAEIESWLTDEQKAYADEIVGYMSGQLSDMLNEASITMHGYSKFLEEYYFPYRVNAAHLPQSVGDVEARLIRSMGMAHSTTANASKPVELGEFTDIATEHIQMALLYATVAPAQNDFMRLLNYKYEDGDTMTVKLKEAFGAEAVSYIKDFMRDIYGGKLQKGTLDKLADKTTGLMKRNAVAFSASVVLQQYWSLQRAMAVIGPQHFYGKLHNPSASWREAQKYAGTVVLKDIGRFDTNVGRNVSEWIADRKEYTKGRRAAELTDEYLIGWLPEKADMLAWARLWNACKREQARKTGLDINSEELKQIAGRRMDEVVRRTQVYDSVFSKSAHMRNKNWIAKTLTNFMAEPTIIANMTIDAWRNAKKDPAQWARTMGALAVSTVLTNAFAALAYAWRDKDEDETYWEKWVQALVSGAVGDLNFMGYIPGLNDAMSIFQGYSTGRSDLAFLSDAYSYFKSAVRDDRNMTVNERLINVALGLGALTGQPVKNAYRDISGIARAIRNTGKVKLREDAILNAAKWGAAEGSVLAQMLGIEDSKSRSTDQLFEALANGDLAVAQEIRKHLIEYNGAKDDEAVDSLLRTRIKEGYLDEEIDAEQAIDLLTTHAGLSETEAEKRVNEWTYSIETGVAYADMKEAFMSGEITAEDAVKARVEYGGAEADEADATVRKWQFEAEHGYAYADLRTEYIDGNVTRQEAEKALVSTGGKDADDAYWTLEEWDYGDTWHGKSTRLNAALVDGPETEILSAMQELLEHSDWEKPGNELASMVTAVYKPIYEATQDNERDEMREWILECIRMAYEAAGEEYYGDEYALRYRSWLKK